MTHLDEQIKINRDCQTEVFFVIYMRVLFSVSFVRLATISIQYLLAPDFVAAISLPNQIRRHFLLERIIVKSRSIFTLKAR